MARSRTLKPGFFKNEDLVELPFEYRLLFAGLWTIADRDGRLEDRAKRIKMEIFPADDVNVEAGLDKLAAAGLIDRYEVDGLRFIEIANFNKHQHPHFKEQPSVIPPKPNKDAGSVDALGKPEASSVQAGLLSYHPTTLPPSNAAVAAGDDLAEAEHQSVVVVGVMKELGLKTLSTPARRAWSQASVLAFKNGFTPDEFLECLTLLRNQTWRTSAVKPQHVTDNLTELPKLRAEARQHAPPKSKLPTLEDKQAERENARQHLTPPPVRKLEIAT